MRHIYWMRSRIGRLLGILAASIVYVFLLTLNGVNFYPHTAAIAGSYWPGLMQFGFSALVSLVSLAVGTLVWLYARNRRVAILLFLYCLAVMAAFAVETGSTLSDALPLLSSIGGVASTVALYLFALLVLVFPKNTLSLIFSSDRESRQQESNGTSRQRFFIFLYRAYVIVLTSLCVISIVFEVLYYSLSTPLFIALSGISYAFDVLALSGAIVAIIISYSQSSSRRERQQLRLFVGGSLLAIAPLLFLTILPAVLGLTRYVVSPEISTITSVLLPLVLGYSILRYQTLVLDRYIRVAVAWMVGIVSLIVLGYIVFTVSSMRYIGNSLASAALAVVLMGLLSPWVWRFARTVTEKVCFREILHFRRQLDRLAPDMLEDETLDLNAVARLLFLAVVDAFATQEVALYVLDEDTGYYRLAPLLREYEPGDVSRRALVVRLACNVDVGQPGNVDVLSAGSAIVLSMLRTRRPLLLSEASEESLPSGLARYLTTSSPPLDGHEPLLAPVRARGKLIAVLALGERVDHQQYAGPDFEVLSLLFSRFAPLLETARLYERSNRHAAILNTLYSASTMDLTSFDSVEEVAGAYSKIAAEAVLACAEIWLYGGEDNQLRSATHCGTGPRLTREDNLLLVQLQDWIPRFSELESLPAAYAANGHAPAQLIQAPLFPFAWLPLQKGQQKIGMLVITYPRPHLFLYEEKRVLEMFAVQCADALENTRMTIELRAAYARQKELDQLKDQFIATASHELRTPLTAVQGYIELLAAYDGDLDAVVRAEFIAKANRGCDELNLMVGNIMDASRVEIDVKNVQLSKLSLSESVQHVLEILEAITRHEKRVISADIPVDIYVMADQMRLRQVLLNLLSNALKYSPSGSPIEISARGDQRQVALCVRDYGSGVPPEDHERLFERFVRLERDINSTVRGAGLGLYISKQLIEAMEGQINLISSGVPGEGSRFSFTLQRSPMPQSGSETVAQQQTLLER